jgi:cytochrome c556
MCRTRSCSAASLPPAWAYQNDYNEFADDYADNEEKKKRKRKTKDEVERDFKCLLSSCDKSYGWTHQL